MLVEPRPITLALALLACLYFGLLLRVQSKQNVQLADVREGIHHYVADMLPGDILPWGPWKSGHSDSKSPPPVDLDAALEPPSVTTTTSTETAPEETSGETSETVPENSPFPTSASAVSYADDMYSERMELPHLRDLCKETDWTPNLWLHCHSGCGASKSDFCGGLNNARNRLQTCVRWAIDAGAGLILPSVVMRGKDPGQLNVGGEKCLDVWWDLSHLDGALGANCPQMKLRAACPADEHGTVAIPPPKAPSIPPLKPAGRQYMERRWSKGAFRDNVILPALASADFTNATNHANVTVIEYGDPFLGWDYRASGELNTVRRELHLAIRFQAPLLALGEEIRRSAQLHGGAYIGVHLRGESDWPADWGNADQQMALYSAEMARLRAVEEEAEAAASGYGYGSVGGEEEERVSAVYVSSGSQPAIQRFREMLEPSGYVVHDKWTILEALDETGELSLLDDIDFDSKGIVDYAVLAGAKHFMGVYMSTMSQYIAYTRTADIPDFFDDVIFANSTRDAWNNRIFSQPFTMHGDDSTSILVTNGLDLMDAFP